ncbi:MAG TPA: sugar phosphate isomerase/epimerase family protein [Bryobacteraceae bacterium]|nr:sugar phosphate isomerase/epimerase family protein [Bryobacteraceae bacterium]
MLSRRAFLAAGVATLSAGALPARPAGLKIGVMDGPLRLSGKPSAIGLAKSLGFAGLQVTIGRPAAGGPLPLEDPALQQAYLAESKKHDLPIYATYLDVLHVNCLKNDALARQWVLKGIGITRALQTRVLMTVFFGKCALENRAETDYAADAFRELAPEAEKAGVVIGFENLLSAGENARALDRVGSRAFQVYYDVGNAVNLGGFDPAEEIRSLGRGRICQFHFKDKGYLGEGKVDYPAVLKAIEDIRFEGYANLETIAPSGNSEADLRRNLAYLRGLMR